MKWLKLLFILACTCCFGMLAAQVPQQMNFQAVVRDSDGELMKDQNIRIAVHIHQGTPEGNTVFNEWHNVKTNANGLVTLEVGTGEPIPINGDLEYGFLEDIDWSKGPYFIHTALDINGNFGYVGTVSPILSVPYAFHAATADSLAGGFQEKDGSVENEIQHLRVSAQGDTLYLSKANWVIIPGISATNMQSSVVEDAFTSQALQGNPIGNDPNRKMTVYLPPGYNQGEAYPVLYLLPGLPFDHKCYLDDSSWHAMGLDAMALPPDYPAEGFQKWMDNLILEGKVREMIVVIPDATSAYGFCMYTNSMLNGGFESYIAEDLVSYVDAHYKTIPDRSGRIIMGHSQGGFGAINLAAKHADVFGYMAANSPLIDIHMLRNLIPAVILENPGGMQGPDPSKFFTTGVYAFSAAWSPNPANPPFYVDLPFSYPDTAVIQAVWDKWLTFSPRNLLSPYAANLQSLDGFYYDCGSEDELGFYTPEITVINESLNWLGVDFEFQGYQGGHWNKLFERMEIALEYISGRMKQVP